jgi:hypothetical protein
MACVGRACWWRVGVDKCTVERWWCVIVVLWDNLWFCVVVVVMVVVMMVVVVVVGVVGVVKVKVVVCDSERGPYTAVED